MQSFEELRDAFEALQRQNFALGIEKANADLLIKAAERLLGDDSADPFAGVFVALREVFEFSAAVVLSETDSGQLECVVADPEPLIDSRWIAGPFLCKVLGGRVATTLTNEALLEWSPPPAPTLSPRQPALYLPVGMGGRRGLMILLRALGEEGFERRHVVLARKFAILASLAFATRAHRQYVAESRRLRSLATRLQQSQALLTHRANHDALTDLPNRSYIQELFHDAVAGRCSGERIALAFVDIDDFKRVNDLYSHGVGDALLKAIASRIRACIRSGDQVGRVSGDEFVILIRSRKGIQEIEAMAERLLARLKDPFDLDGYELSSSATIGIALFPDHGDTFDSLRRAADIAMYTGKQAAKGSVSWFTAEMGRQATAHMLLEGQMRSAVADRRFRCMFQPKLDLVTRHVVGFEALVRWIAADGTIHGPDGFLEAASEFGMLDEIALIALDDSLASIPDLDACYGGFTHFSFNVSARQASHHGFMTRLVRRIAATGRPERFMIEVTEDALVETRTLRSRILPMLRAHRIRLSIDDFGSGYSSLSTLADVPADELKVDRSFITAIHQRPRSQSVLKAIESLAGALGMAVVAEGIETADERDYILSHTGIRIGQGFLFARPQFVEELLVATDRLTA